MIKGKVIDTPSREYRALPFDSYSTLKDFSKDPKKYYRKYILGEKIREKISEDLIMGDLVDCLLFSPNEYEKRFLESNIKELEKGKTHMGDFTITLFELTEQCLDDEGNVTKDFATLAEEAFNLVKYDYNGNAVKFLRSDLKYAIDKFCGTEFEEWYEIKRKGYNKTIIDLSQKAHADAIVDELRNNEFTKGLFYNDTEDDIEIITQLQISFDLFGLPFKSMPDLVRINHTKKIIYPYDLKVTWDVNTFSRNYLDNRYYIQVGCYDTALFEWATNNGMGDYHVYPITFITSDSINYFNPLQYKLNLEDLGAAYNGFYLKNGRCYVGVKELVEDLKWAKENSIWNISRKNYQNKGIINLDLQYE